MGDLIVVPVAVLTVLMMVLGAVACWGFIAVCRDVYWLIRRMWMVEDETKDEW